MIAPEMPSEPGIISTSAIEIVPGQKAFSLFTRRSPKTDRPRIQAKTIRDEHGNEKKVPSARNGCYIGVSNFLAYRLARGRRAHRDVAPHPYRVGSTALQPAVPADRTRAAAPGRRNRHGGDSVQPAGRGSTQRQIPA